VSLSAPARRRAVALLGLAPILGASLGAGLAAAPAAASSGRCDEGTGVTVVVDPGPLGGGVMTGCAPDGAGDTGSAVVTAAGFPLTFVSGQPFVCRIDGLPTADDEDCAGTPPADAYWGLFWSDGDPASWTYSSVGITGLEVPEGGSIGWRWQDGGARDEPGAAPNAQPDDQPDQPTEDPSDPPTQGPSSSPSHQPSHPPTHPPTTGPSPQPSAPAAPTGTGGGGSVSGASSPPGSPTPSAASGSAGSTRGSGDPSPRVHPSSGLAAAHDGSRRTPGPSDGAGAAGSSTRVSAEAAAASSEPNSLATSGSRSVVPWVAAAVLLGLAAGAAVLGRRRRPGS
jgi:hypothetical protein